MTDEVRVVALDRLRPGDIADRSGELLDVVFGWADFARFTDRARRAVIAARQEAIRRRHDRVLPEHLTLGMLHEQEGLAARAIAALGVSPEAARAAHR